MLTPSGLKRKELVVNNRIKADLPFDVNGNLVEATRFLTLLAPDQPVTFQTFVDDKSNGNGARIFHGSLTEHWDMLARLNRDGHGIYLMVNEGDLTGRTASNVLRIRAVFVDLDGSPLDPIQDAPLKPHLVVESSPGRYHAYWLIDGLAPDLFKSVQRALAARFNGDSKVCDLCRVMRVPGFLHRKGTPFMTRIIKYNDLEAYGAEKFLGAFDIDTSLGSAKNKVKPGNSTDGDLIYEGDRNRYLTSLAGAMRRKGASAEAIREALLMENEERCDPPLEDLEVLGIAASISRYDPDGREFALTDLGNAERFSHYHGQDLKYCGKLGGWMVWTGNVWVVDETGEVKRRAKEAVRAIGYEASDDSNDKKRKAITKHAKDSERKARIDSMVALAESDSGIAATAEEFDTDPYLLNCVNGTLDLRTGQLREHCREDLMTKMVAVEYDPNATCPVFDGFLEDIFEGDPIMIAFLQKALGYSLTGVTREQCWFFLHGNGANGKSTLVNVILSIMGDYAVQTPADTFLQHTNEGPRNDLARLRGARLISASEPDGSRRLAEAMLKSFTGQDKITCRFLHKEYFSFMPEGKVFFSANHKPSASGTDYGFWRRVRMIPFKVKFSEETQDKSLPDKLKAEGAGILAWMVDGCLKWQKEGLGLPDEVKEATEGYQEEMDPVGDFLAISHDLEFGIGKKIPVNELYKLYQAYCEREGEKYPLNKPKFTQAVEGKGYPKRRLGPKTSREYCFICVGKKEEIPSTIEYVISES